MLDCVLYHRDYLVCGDLEVRVVESLSVGQTVLGVGLLALNLLKFFAHFSQQSHFLAYDQQLFANPLSKDLDVLDMIRELGGLTLEKLLDVAKDWTNQLVA